MFNDSFKNLIDLIIKTLKIFANLILIIIKTCLFWIWVFLPIIAAILIWLFSHPFKYKIIIILLLDIFNYVWAFLILTAEMSDKE